jgi:hypothetical protein
MMGSDVLAVVLVGAPALRAVVALWWPAGNAHTDVGEDRVSHVLGLPRKGPSAGQASSADEDACSKGRPHLDLGRQGGPRPNPHHGAQVLRRCRRIDGSGPHLVQGLDDWVELIHGLYGVGRASEDTALAS